VPKSSQTFLGGVVGESPVCTAARALTVRSILKRQTCCVAACVRGSMSGGLAASRSDTGLSGCLTAAIRAAEPPAGGVDVNADVVVADASCIGNIHGLQHSETAGVGVRERNQGASARKARLRIVCNRSRPPGWLSGHPSALRSEVSPQPNPGPLQSHDMCAPTMIACRCSGNPPQPWRP